MKKYFLYTLFVFVCHDAFGACEVESARYACKPGYYLSGNSCVACPDTDIYTNSNLTTQVAATTDDYNQGGLDSCYIPAGTYYDKKGTFTISSNCTPY